MLPNASTMTWTSSLTPLWRTPRDVFKHSENLGLVAPPAEVLAIPNVQIPLKVCHHAEILTPDRGVDFKKEHENSVEALVNDQPVRVASREFLIRMKTGTGRKQDAIDLRLLASSG